MPFKYPLLLFCISILFTSCNRRKDLNIFRVSNHCTHPIVIKSGDQNISYETLAAGNTTTVWQHYRTSTDSGMPIYGNEVHINAKDVLYDSISCKRKFTDFNNWQEIRSDEHTWEYWFTVTDDDF